MGVRNHNDHPYPRLTALTVASLLALIAVALLITAPLFKTTLYSGYDDYGHAYAAEQPEDSGESMTADAETIGDIDAGITDKTAENVDESSDSDSGICDDSTDAQSYITVSGSIADMITGASCAVSDPVRDNYTFAGYEDDNGNLVDYKTASTRASYSSLKARWIPDDYHIVYTDDSTGETKTTSRGAYESAGLNDARNALRVAAESHPYEDFAGWTDDSGNTVSDVSGEPGEDIIVHASWTGRAYGITYNLDGGANSDSNPSEYTYGTGVQSFADATKDGYVFDGWSEDADGQAMVNGIPSDEHGDVTLYAVFHEEPAQEQKEDSGSSSASGSDGSTGSSAKKASSKGKAGRSSKSKASSASDDSDGSSSGNDWSAKRSQSQSTVDAGYLTEWVPGYFAAHRSNSYGKAISQLSRGDVVTINGRRIMIDGQVSGNYNTDSVESIRARIPSGEVELQTCTTKGGGSIIVKYGHYI